MKFQIEQRDLLAGIQRVIGVVERRNTLPILSHILITARLDPSQEEASNISIFATDLEIGVYDSYPARVFIPGQIAYPAKKLLDITRTLPEGTIDIEAHENHWISIQSGKASFKIAGLPPEQFPAFPPSETGDVNELRSVVNIHAFSKLIRKTLFAAGENDARYILNGILVSLRKGSGEKDVLRVVATDGHRLAISEDTLKINSGATEEESAIMPKKGMIEIKRLLDSAVLKKQDDATDAIELLLTPTLLTVRYEKSTVFSRLLHGVYPKYQQVVPQACDKKVEVSRMAVLGALARVSALSEERTTLVEMSLQTGEMVLNVRAAEGGEAFETIPTSYCGDKMTLRFIAHHLRELLSAIDDDLILIELKEEKTPCMIQEQSGHNIFVFVPSVES